MRKRLILLLITIVTVVLSLNLSKAEASNISSDYCDYTTFSYMQFSRGKLLKNYSEQELKPYIKATHKKRFYGWPSLFELRKQMGDSEDVWKRPIAALNKKAIELWNTYNEEPWEYEK